MPERGPLEVTIVAHAVGPVGGMERQLSALIGGLLDDGHRVTVVARVCRLDPHERLRFVRVPGPRRPFTLAYPWFFLAGTLLVALKRRGPVHTTGAIVLNRAGVSTVHFCHAAASEAPRFSRAARSALAYRLNARLAPYMSRFAERLCYRPGRTERLIAVSGGVTAELRRHFPAMADRVATIPNGVDTDAFRPAEPNGNGNGNGDEPGSADRLRAIFVGGEWERKGLRFAIEALPDSPGTALTVVGPGDEAAYGELAGRLGVADRVHFAGRSEDVASWYRRSDLFVLPTSYEAAPLVTYEAAASALPLLVTRVNGVEDLLRDGVNGWFIERDGADIGRRLRELAADPALVGSMGRTARSDSLEYSWRRVVESYEELYAELAAP